MTLKVQKFSSFFYGFFLQDRKVAEKIVVTVKLDEHEGKKKSDQNPSCDCWSWRKYGQKPIKGSPYPRFLNLKFMSYLLFLIVISIYIFGKL